MGDIRWWKPSLYYSYKASKSDRAEVLEVLPKLFYILDQLNKSYTLLHPMIFDIRHNTPRPSYIWLCCRNLLVKIAFPSNGYFGFTHHFCFFSAVPGLRILKDFGFVSVALTSQRYYEADAASCVYRVHKQFCICLYDLLKKITTCADKGSSNLASPRFECVKPIVR